MTLDIVAESDYKLSIVRDKWNRGVPLGPNGITLEEQGWILEGLLGPEIQAALQQRLNDSLGALGQPLPTVRVTAFPLWMYALLGFAVISAIRDRR